MKINKINIGGGFPLVLIAGPCVIENYERTYKIACILKTITKELGIPFIFKASYDKANRTSIHSFRGPGIDEGLRILSEIKTKLNIPILSDIHKIDEIEKAAEVLDILQVPAFLCRQTDLVVEIARTNKPINIKKGQFLAPWDMVNVVEKIKTTGNYKLLLTERGTMFGYNNLVVDFRSIKIMQDIGFPVIFDATHSVQLPGEAGNSSGGQREFVSILARAAVAIGVNGLFLEVHEDPNDALCDGPNSLDLPNLFLLLKGIKKINA